MGDTPGGRNQGQRPGAEIGSRFSGKTRQRNCSRGTQRPKYVSAHADSGSAQGCSPSAQVKTAAAHVRRLERNQRKKKSSMTILVISDRRILTDAVLLNT
jgi:hypothetical protein